MVTKLLILTTLGHLTIILGNYDLIKKNNVERSLKILIGQTMLYIQMVYRLANKL